MSKLDRRQFLGLAAAAPAALGLAGAVRAAEEPGPPYVSCFYQFGQVARDALGGPEGLPNGEGFLHVLSHSHPGIRAHPDTARQVHALGSSFKYALALDVHKYEGWQQASDDQLRQWATEFRELALVADDPVDYFAFNEMPTTGAFTPNLQQQAARWLRHLYEAGGGPKLPGVFYFTERNLNPTNWQADSDDFWQALDDTCELVVGEHYHSHGFAFSLDTEAKLAGHFFALPRWLNESGKPAQVSIAQSKYLVLHSSYYGPDETGWHGVHTTTHDEAALQAYYEHLVKGTRCSPFGKDRIGFGPLATQKLDPRSATVLARVLAADARQHASSRSGAPEA